MRSTNRRTLERASRIRLDSRTTARTGAPFPPRLRARGTSPVCCRHPIWQPSHGGLARGTNRLRRRVVDRRPSPRPATGRRRLQRGHRLLRARLLPGQRLLLLLRRLRGPELQPMRRRLFQLPLLLVLSGQHDLQRQWVVRRDWLVQLQSGFHRHELQSVRLQLLQLSEMRLLPGSYHLQWPWSLRCVGPMRLQHRMDRTDLQRHDYELARVAGCVAHIPRGTGSRRRGFRASPADRRPRSNDERRRPAAERSGDVRLRGVRRPNARSSVANPPRPDRPVRSAQSEGRGRGLAAA